MNQLRPPAQPSAIGQVRTLIMLIGAVIALALTVGYLQHQDGTPVDDGTPATLTTIGGPR